MSRQLKIRGIRERYPAGGKAGGKKLPKNIKAQNSKVTATFWKKGDGATHGLTELNTPEIKITVLYVFLTTQSSKQQK